MTELESMTVQLNSHLKTRLSSLAKTMQRSESELVASAIAEFVAAQEWQVAAILEGIADADRGDLIDHKEIEAWVRSWGSND